MAKMNVQNTQLYVVDVPATAWADCTAAVTAIKAGKKAECIQAFGELSRTRDVKEYSCQDSNGSDKAAGKIAYGDITIGLLLDPENKTGQEALFNAMENNTAVVVGFESPEGSIIWTEALVTGDKIGMPDGGRYLYDVTISPYGGFNRCPKK